MAGSLGIGLLVWVIVNVTHVAAHLVVARKLGVAVNRVSLGFGPTLWSRMVGATTYRLAILPIAFVVRLRAPWAAGAPEAPSNDLRNRSRWARLAVFCSAPAAVLLLGFVSAFWASGFERTQRSDKPVVGDVRRGGPADRAGLLAGDTIAAVGGQKVETWAELKRLIAGATEDVLVLDVRRSTGSMRLEVQPDTMPGTSNKVIGIGPAMVAQPPPPFIERFGNAVEIVRQWGGLLVEGVSTVVVGMKEPAVVRGPVALYASASAGTNGRDYFLATAVTFAILQYFLLCLVAPYLDGRRLLFLGIEAIGRKPLRPKYEDWFNRIWLGLFLMLAVLAIKSDVSRFLLR